MGNQRKKRAKHPGYVFLTLTLIFIMPLVLAWIFYSEKDTLGEGTVNHGYLINPPFSITQLKLFNARGQRLNNTFSKKRTMPSATWTNGKWLLLFLSPGPCQKTCEKGLYNMRQIRQATGRERNRIERAILSYKNSSSSPKLRKLLNGDYDGTRLLKINQQQFQRVIRKKISQPYALKAGTLYIVDPLGNVMMTYKPDADPSAIYKDMKRLLKVSQIG